MTELCSSFDGERGSVTPEILEKVYAHLGQQAPDRSDLEKFIEEIYSERETAAAIREKLPENRSVLSGEGADGEKIRTCYRKPADGFETRLDKELFPHQAGTTTLWELFQASKSRFPDNPFYGTAPTADDDYKWETYQQIGTRVENFSRGLIEIGLKPKQLFGIMLDTSAEYGIVQNGLFGQSMAVVTMYSTYGVEAIKFIVDHTELEVFATSKKNLPILKSIVDKCPSLKQIIYVGDKSDLDGTISLPEGIKITTLTEVEQLGASSSHSFTTPSASDLAFIVYTSGTTGNPKGVMHSHSNLLACTAANSRIFAYKSDDVHVAFLPLAHIMEQFLECMMIAAGTAIAFWSGDIRVLMKNVAKARPTKFIAVPRLLNRLYVQLRGMFNSLQGEKRELYERAFESKKQWLQKGVFKSFYDPFVFKQARSLLGDRCSMIATGSAPIDPGMLEFFRIVFSATVMEGYGMTEVLITNSTYPTDVVTRSHIGPPNTAVEVKLESIPDMKYLATNDPPRGEVCFRGPMNMLGYYKDPEKTAETIDSDGWIHTGDVGEWLPDGSLRLIDRKKHIFKLSQGEYVAPEKLEQVFVHSKYVAQIFVNGNSFQPALVAVVVVDPTIAESTRKERNIDSVEKLFQDEDFKKLVLKDIEEIGRGSGALGFEIPRAVHFIDTPFEQLGLLTPTFKMKRNEAREHFHEICEELFKLVNE